MNREEQERYHTQILTHLKSCNEQVHIQSEKTIQDSTFRVFASGVIGDSKNGTYHKSNILLVNKDYLPSNVKDIRFTKFNEFVFDYHKD